MQIQPPAGWVFPLPLESYDLSTDLLRDGQNPLHPPDPPSSATEFNKKQCGRCKSEFPETAGYYFRNSFYCEDCNWFLAEQGEFYCG